MIYENIKNSFLMCYRDYFDFYGKISRIHFWPFFIFSSLVPLIIRAILENYYIYYITETTNLILSVIFLFVFSIPQLSSCVRRLNDINRSPWWLIIVVTGVGYIVILYWLCLSKNSYPLSWLWDKASYYFSKKFGSVEDYEEDYSEYYYDKLAKERIQELFQEIEIKYNSGEKLKDYEKDFFIRFSLNYTTLKSFDPSLNSVQDFKKLMTEFDFTRDYPPNSDLQTALEEYYDSQLMDVNISLEKTFRSAQAGNVAAMFDYGNILIEPIQQGAINKFYEGMAVSWIKKAANEGMAEAIAMVGIFHFENNNYVENNPEKGKEMMEKAISLLDNPYSKRQTQSILDGLLEKHFS